MEFEREEVGGMDTHKFGKCFGSDIATDERQLPSDEGGGGGGGVILTSRSV